MIWQETLEVLHPFKLSWLFKKPLKPEDVTGDSQSEISAGVGAGTWRGGFFWGAADVE